MKKIFALAMAIVSMAAVMTSCSDDNADFIEQSAPVAQQEKQEVKAIVEFLLPVTDVQLEIMDIKINYTIDGQTHIVTPQEMTEIEFPTLNKPTRVTGVGEPKLLSYRLPGTYTKQQIEAATYQNTIAENAEGLAKYEGQKVNVFCGFSCALYNAAYSVERMSFYYGFLQDCDLCKEGAKEMLFETFDDSIKPMLH